MLMRACPVPIRPGFLSHTLGLKRLTHHNVAPQAKVRAWRPRRWDRFNFVRPANR